MNTSSIKNLGALSDIQKHLLSQIVEDNVPDVSARWERLAVRLNSLEGAIKSPQEWKDIWQYYRSVCVTNQHYVDSDEDEIIPNGSITTSSQVVCTDSGNQENTRKRSLENEDLCRRIILRLAGIPLNKPIRLKILATLSRETQYDCLWMWKGMQMVTKNKLRNLLAVKDCSERLPQNLRMSIIDWMLFDMILVHQDFDVTGLSDDPTIVNSVLVDLFKIVKEYKIESLSGDILAEAWAAATVAYNKGNRKVTPMLLQKRWYQLKLSTRNKYYQYESKRVDETSATPLQAAIAKQYPEVWTRAFKTWEEQIQNDLVILRERFELIAVRARNKKKVVVATVPKPVVLDVVDLDSDTDSNSKDIESPSGPEITIKQEDSDIDIEESILYKNRIRKRSELPEIMRTDLKYDDEKFKNDETSFGDEAITTITSNNQVDSDGNSVIDNNINCNPIIEFKNNQIEAIADNLKIEDNVTISNEPELVLPQITNVFGNVNITHEYLIDHLVNQFSLNNNSCGIKTEPSNISPEDPMLVDDSKLICNANPVQDGEIIPQIGRINDYKYMVARNGSTDISRIDPKLRRHPIVHAVKLDDNKEPFNCLQKSNSQKKNSADPQSVQTSTEWATNNKVKLNNKLYDRTQLFRNPDFNTHLKKLPADFFRLRRNRLLLETCTPVTVDVIKCRTPRKGFGLERNGCGNFENRRKTQQVKLSNPLKSSTSIMPYNFCRIAPKPANVMSMVTSLEKSQINKNLTSAMTLLGPNNSSYDHAPNRYILIDPLKQDTTNTPNRINLYFPSRLKQATLETPLINAGNNTTSGDTCGDKTTLKKHAVGNCYYEVSTMTTDRTVPAPCSNNLNILNVDDTNISQSGVDNYFYKVSIVAPESTTSPPCIKKPNLEINKIANTGLHQSLETNNARLNRQNTSDIIKNLEQLVCDLDETSVTAKTPVPPSPVSLCLDKNEILLTTTKLPAKFKTFYSEMLRNIRLSLTLPQGSPEISSSLSELMEDLAANSMCTQQAMKTKNVEISLDIILKNEALTPITSQTALEYASSRNGLFFKINLNTGSMTPVKSNMEDLYETKTT